jgi:hypothetical protein
VTATQPFDQEYVTFDPPGQAHLALDVPTGSTTMRYDLMPAHALGIGNEAYVDRGSEPSTPYYGQRPIRTITQLPGLFAMATAPTG